MVHSTQRRRHPDAPRFLQWGDGSRAEHRNASHHARTPHARSLARLKNAVHRDDAFDDSAFEVSSR
jgi:hypothetical protein